LPETLEKPEVKNPKKPIASIFPVESYSIKNLATPLGHKGNSFQGASLYSAENPPNGAILHWMMNQDVKSIKDLRKEAEKEKVKNNLPVNYPSKDSIRLESIQESPYLLVRITSESGELIREFRESAKKGLKKTIWDGRRTSTGEVNFHTPDPDNPYDSGDIAAFVAPGKYTAQVMLMQDGKLDAISAPTEIVINNALSANENKDLLSFKVEVEEMRRIVSGTVSYLDHLKNKIKFIKAAKVKDAAAQSSLHATVSSLEIRMKQVEIALQGDRSIARKEFETLPGISGRVDNIVYNWWSTTQIPSTTYKEQLNLVKDLFRPVYNEVKQLDIEIEKIEAELEKQKAPATPGRLPDFK
jgi:hypothetical protein